MHVAWLNSHASLFLFLLLLLLLLLLLRKEEDGRERVAGVERLTGTYPIVVLEQTGLWLLLLRVAKPAKPKESISSYFCM